jgi:hypothetical protein
MRTPTKKGQDGRLQPTRYLILLKLACNITEEIILRITAPTWRDGSESRPDVIRNSNGFGKLPRSVARRLIRQIGPVSCQAMLRRSGKFSVRATARRVVQREAAARIFKVPLGTIRKLWPHLPLCTPAMRIAYFKDSDHRQADSTAPALQANFNPADLLTPKQLAQRLQVSLGWMREKTRKRNRNKLPALPLGRFVRFYWPDVCRWMMDQQNQEQTHQ